jgi:hypothetical protein
MQAAADRVRVGGISISEMLKCGQGAEVAARVPAAVTGRGAKKAAKGRRHDKR